MSLRAGWTRVYLKRGARVHHLLTPNTSANDFSSAVCGRTPNLGDLNWWGTGSQEEYDTAELLPMCIGCASAYRRQGGDE